MMPIRTRRDRMLSQQRQKIAILAAVHVANMTERPVTHEMLKARIREVTGDDEVAELMAIMIVKDALKGT